MEIISSARAGTICIISRRVCALVFCEHTRTYICIYLYDDAAEQYLLCAVFKNNNIMIIIHDFYLVVTSREGIV